MPPDMLERLEPSRCERATSSAMRDGPEPSARRDAPDGCTRPAPRRSASRYSGTPRGAPSSRSESDIVSIGPSYDEPRTGASPRTPSPVGASANPSPRPRRPRPPRRRRRRGASPNSPVAAWSRSCPGAGRARSLGSRSSSDIVSIESASITLFPTRTTAAPRPRAATGRPTALRRGRPRSSRGSGVRRGRAGASDCLSGTSVIERSSSPSAATRRPLRDPPASTLAIEVISMNWSATSTRSLLVFARKLTTSTRTPMSWTARIAGAKSPSPEITTAMSSFGARRTRSTTSSMSRFALKRPSPYLRTSLLTTL